MDDLEALRRFAEAGDVGAFQEIVRRHVDLVYAAARRQMRDAAGAEDVTQAVFLLLMNKAGGMARGSWNGLAGWLLAATHFACRAARRAEARRAYHERKAMRMRKATISAAEAGWDEIAPVLDEALMGLSARDRAAVGMRCLEERTFVEVGVALGISEEAARKRVERALEKLRAMLTRQGVMAPAGLAGMLAVHGAEKAPASVVAGLASSAGAGSPVAALAKGTAQLLRWGQVKVAVMASAAVVTLGVMTGVATWKGDGAHASPVIIAVSAPATHPPEAALLGAVRVGDRMVFSGEVVDAQGNAIANAAFRVFDFHPWPELLQEAQGVTGADGRFSTGPVLPDRPNTLSRQIVIDAPGYAYAWWSPISSEPLWRPRKIVLQKGMVVSGMLRDQDGKAVEGAEVRADLQSRDYGEFTMNEANGLSVKTDASGRFVFDRIPPRARMHVTARAAGHATVSTWDGYRGDSAPVVAGTTDLELTMGREAVARGQLMHEGKPAAKEGVVIGAWERNLKGWWTYGKTDANGRVELRGLAPGTWDIGVSGEEPSAEAEHVQTTTVKLETGDLRDVTLGYDEGVLVRGMVHDATGHTEQLPVYIKASGVLQMFERKVLPNATGEFETRVLPGAYEVLAYSWVNGDMEMVKTEVNVTAKGLAGVEMVVEPVPVVKGQLTDEAGNGVKGMVALNEDRCVYTDDTGRFEIERLEAKESMGLAVDASGKSGVGFFYNAGDSGELKLVVQPMGAIVGRVVDGAGNGVGGAQVRVEILGQRKADGEGTIFDGNHWVWGVTVQQDGSYRIAPVPPGYTLILSARQDEWEGSKRVSPLDAGEEQTVNLVMGGPRVMTRGGKAGRAGIPAAAARDAKITGKLVDADGKPLVGWRVSWDKELEVASTATDFKGRFVLEGLPAGKTVQVYASSEGRKGEWQVETGKEGVELKLNP